MIQSPPYICDRPNNNNWMNFQLLLEYIFDFIFSYHSTSWLVCQVKIEPITQIILAITKNHPMLVTGPTPYRYMEEPVHISMNILTASVSCWIFVLLLSFFPDIFRKSWYSNDLTLILFFIQIQIQFQSLVCQCENFETHESSEYCKVADFYLSPGWSNIPYNIRNLYS